MPTTDHLAQNEKILRTNRRHQCKTHGKASEPGRNGICNPHAAILVNGQC
jgi:hypothetical protein